MNPLKRPQPPSPEQIEASARSVIDTVRQTGLDPESTLIMGGSALALAGIRPAGDVDLIVPKFVYETIRIDSPWSTPSGIALRLKARSIYPVFETYGKQQPKDLMHIDITTPKRDYGDDEKFMEALEQYETFEGYRFLPATLVAARKMKRGDRMRRKDEKDIELIREHLEKNMRDNQ